VLGREPRFRAIFERSAVGIALVAPDGRWLQVNPAVTRLLGYTESEFRGVDFQSLTHPEDLGAELACMRRAFAGKIEHYELEKRYFHKNGGIVTASLTASLIRDRGGRPLHFILQLMDVTELRQSQQEIARLRAQLAHASRVSLTSRLTASLAHQLLQPITAILGNVEAGQHALRRASLPNVSSLEAILEDIGICGKAAAAVIELVRGLLRSEPEPLEQLDFDQVVSDVVKVVQVIS
jgi:PAS domain S-box-containing protein